MIKEDENIYSSRLEAFDCEMSILHEGWRYITVRNMLVNTHLIACSPQSGSFTSNKVWKGQCRMELKLIHNVSHGLSS